MLRRMVTRFSCLVPTIALVGLCSQASATPYYVRSTATADTGGIISNGQHNTADTGQVQATSNSAGPFSADSRGASYDFSAEADILTEIGAIHSSVTTGASSSAPSGPPGGGSASTVGSWSDTITITSDSLPAGTPVSFLATLTLHRTITGTRDGGTASVQATGPFGLSLADSLSSPNPTQSVSTVINTTVGSTLMASSELDLNADSSGTNIPFSVSAAIFAENTSRFDFEPITPGASYSTASGVMFVPEPASFWLMCCGLAAWGFYGFRFRSVKGMK